MPRRPADQLRTIRATPHYVDHPEGSVLIEFGDTRVLCTASIENRVPGWMHGTGRGWVTAEYDMLPRATNTRRDRDARKGKVNGRSQEISRLIGRALRAAVDLTGFGERSITLDCDVLQADGGTRTAAITGAYIALAIALNRLVEQEQARRTVLAKHVVAVSAGIVDGEAVLDLDYSLDSRADVDMNVVMTSDGQLAEIQGTGEASTFARDQLTTMLDLAFGALPKLVDLQKRAIETPFDEPRITVTL